jgi:hypothetical protein
VSGHHSSASTNNTLSAPPSGKRLLLLLVCFVILVLVLFALYIILSFYIVPARVAWLPPVPRDRIASRGQFGDTFGFVTALFTGLGFAGVAVTLLAQWRTLIHQREDAMSRASQHTQAQEQLAEQIKLLEKATTAETTALGLQRSATSIDILTRLVEKYDSKEFRNSRYLASVFS